MNNISMRIFVLLCVIFLNATISFAQSQKVKVTMKDGTAITGEMKQIDPAKSVTIVIAGIESEISMSDVASIDPVEETAQTATQATSFEDEWTYEDFNKALPSDSYGEYAILDKAEYPDSFKIEVGGQTFTMILIRGGVFNMGFDGPGSLTYKSEPVHKVKLSSFYVSRERFDEEVACSLLGLESNKKKASKFKTKKWDEAKQLVDKVAEQEGMPYRLLTDAEWEYVAITPYSDTVFRESTKHGDKEEWLFDFFEEYKGGVQTNPTGPASGKIHVVRGCYNDSRKYWRNISFNNPVRLAITADKVKFE